MLRLEGLQAWFRSLIATRRKSSGSKRRNAWGDVQQLESRELLTADVIIQWNDILLDAIRTDRTAPPKASRAMAIVQTSVFDAVNSIGEWYQPYAINLVVDPRASLDAAAAAAAHTALSALFPAQVATFDAALQAQLATIPDGQTETDGVATGVAVAQHILNLRANDGSTAVVNYVPGGNPGDWAPTPPAFANPVLPQWGGVTPFGVSDIVDFRAPAPPSLNSAVYAAAYNQVKSIGSATSATRTADQTQIALFWANGPGTSTPPGHWNVIAQTISQDKGLSLQENARLFALLNISMADAAISAWDSKYVYDMWRPITAIQQGGTDGNAATVADATWAPLLTTPPFPTYTSGHSTFSGAGAAVMSALFGNNTAFTVPSETAGVADRAFTSFWGAAWESGLSRIYGGIHFNFDNTAGLNSGKEIGQQVVTTRLGANTQPLAFIANNTLNVLGTNAGEVFAIVRGGDVYNVIRNGRSLGRFHKDLFASIFVDARGGNDVVSVALSIQKSAEVYGGDGNDVIYGGAGNDRLFGNAGNDRLFGRLGDDYLNGGLGDNYVFGGAGHDNLIKFSV